MPNLTIREIQDKKKVIENWIFERVQEFEKEAEMTVESIEIAHERTITAERLRSVELSCRFPKAPLPRSK